MRVAVVGRAPLEAALVAAGADERVPDELPGLRVEEVVDAALPAEADDVRDRRCVKTFGPEPPRSHFSWSASAGHHVTAAGCEPQTRLPRRVPRRRGTTTAAPRLPGRTRRSTSRYAPGCSQDSLKKPFGAAALQAATRRRLACRAARRCRRRARPRRRRPAARTSSRRRSRRAGRRCRAASRSARGSRPSGASSATIVAAEGRRGGRGRAGCRHAGDDRVADEHRRPGHDPVRDRDAPASSRAARRSSRRCRA